MVAFPARRGLTVSDAHGPVLAALLLCLFGAAGCRGPVREAAPLASGRDTLSWPEVLSLRAARDYFTLRDRVNAVGTSATTPERLARALVEHAFNQPAASNATIADLFADVRAGRAALPDSLVTSLERVRVANDLRLFAYGPGLAAADTMLADTTRLDAEVLRDMRNTQRLLRALEDVPPQTVTVRGTTTLHVARGDIPVRINDSARVYGFDTGANFSVLMRSEALALGLRVRPAGLDVGTSTDQRVTADLAVADRLTLGGVEYRHVVFLVLDDRLLTFADGTRVPGLIGFPVIEPLGEVEWSRDGVLRIPGTVPRRNQHNMALDEFTPLTRVRWLEPAHGLARASDALVCRLDTGAGATEFYEPFYRRFQAYLDTTTEAVSRQSTGAGGVRELPVRVLRHARLAVGDTVAVLDSSDVITRPIVLNKADNFLDCNIGRDVLRDFPSFILNFRDMAFVLR